MGDFEISDDRESVDFLIGLSQKKSETSDEEPETEEVKDEQEEVVSEETEDLQEEDSEETQGDSDETEEVPEDDPTEEPEEPQINEKLVEVAKLADPDAEFESDDQAITSIKEKLDELTSYKKDSDEANAKLVELFEGEPGLKGFIQDVYGGMDPKTAFAMNIDESLAPEEGEDNYEKYKERKEKREKEHRERKERQESIQKNIKETEKVIAKFREEKKMDDTQADEFFKRLDTYMGGFVEGKLSPDFLSIYDKGLRFDEEIKLAEKRGEVRAKNEKAIDRKRKEKEQRTVPSLSKSTEREKEVPKIDPWLQKASKKDRASSGFLT